MTTLYVATACAGLFADAAIYVTAVEHPALLDTTSFRKAWAIMPDLYSS